MKWILVVIFIPIALKAESESLYHEEMNIRIRPSIFKKRERKSVKKPIIKKAKKPKKKIIQYVPKKAETDSKNEGKLLVYQGKGQEVAFLLGHEIKAELFRTVISSNMKTPVKAITIEDEYLNGEIIIPYGAMIHGRAAQSVVNERLEITFQYVTISRYKNYRLSGLALSSDGSAGLQGHYYDEYGKYIKGSLIMNFIGSFGKALMDRQVNHEYGLEVIPGTYKNAIMNALSSVSFEAAERYAENMKRSSPFVVIPRGTPLIVHLEEDLILE